MAQKTMDEETLLGMLQSLEDDSSQYTFGSLQAARQDSVKAYYQRPYGNEEAGWSQAITSDVRDTVEWILPDLLDMFIGSEDAVVFDPTREDEAEGSEQATDTCNYVFYKQNNGFLVLYTAFKDALMEKTCAVHWRKETKRVRTTERFDNVTAIELQMKMQPDDEVLQATPMQPQPMADAYGMPLMGMDGQPVMTEPRFNVRISRVTERKTVRIEAFPPENLLVKRSWTSPLLDECPYVARFIEVTLSDLNEMAGQMGFDPVTAQELAGSDEPNGSMQDLTRMDRTGSDLGDMRKAISGEVGHDDETLTTGWLRIEWVLCDFDGDGIAERREIWRLDNKILSNEECQQVPVCTGSPVLVQHQWDGQSIDDLVGDLQKIRTDLLRSALNNASLAANPRKMVLTDNQGAPYVNVDDLLDYRPGVNLRMTRPDALAVDQTPFVASQVFPIMEYVDGMREQRTGVTKQRMGLDPNALQRDRTLGETQIVDGASRQRVKLIARIMAETIVKPIFKGTLKLLTEGDMDAIAFRLRGKFVQYDPNDWRDSYDMTANVGLGTGDREQKIQVLTRTRADQLALAASPLGPMIVTPQQIYTTQTQILDLSGFKNVDQFWTNPGEKPLPEKPPEPPPWQLQAKQMELQAESQKFQAESQQEFAKAKLEGERKQRELDAQNEMQRQNDERDAQIEAMKADHARELDGLRLQLDRYTTDANNQTRIIVAKIGKEGDGGTTTELDEYGQVVAAQSPVQIMAQALAQLTETMNRPKSVVRDETGRIVGVQ